MAIIAQAVVCGVVAITSSFGRLAVLATVSTLILYLLCCVAAWILRRRDVRVEGASPFTAPGGPIVPVLAVAAIAWLLSSATVREFVLVAAVLAGGALLYALSGARRAARSGVA